MMKSPVLKDSGVFLLAVYIYFKYNKILKIDIEVGKPYVSPLKMSLCVLTGLSNVIMRKTTLNYNVLW